jgi:ribonuclease HII
MTTESLDLADTATTAEPVRTRARPRLIAGVDEAGRGPLAGPVSEAAVILNPRRRIDGLDDSKKLSEARREALYPLILERALAWRIEFVEVEEIDRINIFQATMTGMRRAVIGLAAIMAASILAKVARDRMMRSLHQRYPQYGFDQHKGYSTAAHLAALSAHGPCPHHRRSFAPVRTAYENLSLF